MCSNKWRPRLHGYSLAIGSSTNDAHECALAQPALVSTQRSIGFDIPNNVAKSPAPNTSEGSPVHVPHQRLWQASLDSVFLARHRKRKDDECLQFCTSCATCQDAAAQRSASNAEASVATENKNPPALRHCCCSDHATSFSKSRRVLKLQLQPQGMTTALTSTIKRRIRARQGSGSTLHLTHF